MIPFIRFPDTARGATGGMLLLLPVGGPGALGGVTTAAIPGGLASADPDPLPSRINIDAT